MSTPAQIEANRRNAQQSTGPRTAEGKEKSSRNATKFGLFCRHVLLPDEDEAELEALRDGIHARLRPADALEQLYVDRIVSSSWRLQRALSGEAALFARWKRYRDHATPPEVLAAEFGVKDLDRLQKHIAALERSMDKALAELTRLQKLRRESSDEPNDENEPNSAMPQDAEGETSASARIEIVKTNPIARGKANEVNGEAGNESADRQNAQNEPNSASKPNEHGGGAIRAPAPVKFDVT